MLFKLLKCANMDNRNNIQHYNNTKLFDINLVRNVYKIICTYSIPVCNEICKLIKCFKVDISYCTLKYHYVYSILFYDE